MAGKSGNSVAQSVETPEHLAPFRPHPLIRGGHLQTIVGYYLPSPKQLSGTTHVNVQLPDGDTLVLCENRVNRKSLIRKAVLLMHGLGGNADSAYMVRIGQMFLQRGWTVLRMNHRGCGAGTGLARLTYHSGKSDDVSFLIAEIAARLPDTPLIAIGFSLSGNVLLKLLGEQLYPLTAALKGAIAVNPPLDLALCAQALHLRQNRIYEVRFMRLLQDAVAQRMLDFPDFPKLDIRTSMPMYEFDHLCTAPLHGFLSAADYYEKCSARPFLGDIELSTVLLASRDDPFIPGHAYENLPRNKNVIYHISDSGGHMGFISAKPTALRTHRWLDYATLMYAEKIISEAVSASAT